MIFARAALLLGVLTLSLTRPAHAQLNPQTRLSGFYVSLFSGGAAHSDWQRSFARRLAPATAVSFGVAAGHWITPSWGWRAQAGFIPTRFEVILNQRAAVDLPVEALLADSARYSNLRIWTSDLQLVFRIPVTPGGRVAPYAFAGGGVIRYEAAGNEPLPPEAEPAFDRGRPTEVRTVFGLGALVPLERRGLRLNFELSDRLVRTPVRGEEVQLANHVQLLIGFTWFTR